MPPNYIEFFRYCHVQSEKVKCSVIPQTHAVIDPWAMVIHFRHALAAVRAMVGSYWLPAVTFKARKTILIDRVNIPIIGGRGLPRNGVIVYHYGLVVGPHGHNVDEKERVGLKDVDEFGSGLGIAFGIEIGIKHLRLKKELRKTLKSRSKSA